MGQNDCSAGKVPRKILNYYGKVENDPFLARFAPDSKEKPSYDQATGARLCLKDRTQHAANRKAVEGSSYSWLLTCCGLVLRHIRVLQEHAERECRKHCSNDVR